MPVEYRVIEHNGIFVEAFGTTTGAEVIALKKELYRPDIVESITYQLVDFSRIETVTLSSADMHELVSLDMLAAKSNPDMVIAMVGSSDLMYGLGRMWEGHLGETPLNVAVFRSIETGRDWLKEQLGDTESGIGDLVDSE